MEKKKISTLDKVVGILLIIALIGAGIYFKDTISLFIGSKIQELKVEDQLDKLNAEEKEFSSKPFYVCDGEKFQEEWYSNYGTDLTLIKTILNQSSSDYIWFTNYETDIGDSHYYNCEIFDVDGDTFHANLEAAENYSASKINKKAQEYILHFNKDYKVPVDRLDRIEFPITETWLYDSWDDTWWDGMNADDFYDKYKVVTKVDKIILKKIFMGSYASFDDKDKFINNIRWGEKACMVFQVDITNVKSGEHPLEWFPKSGETKTVNILVDCALGSHGEFCPVKMAIL